LIAIVGSTPQSTILRCHAKATGSAGAPVTIRYQTLWFIVDLHTFKKPGSFEIENKYFCRTIPDMAKLRPAKFFSAIPLPNLMTLFLDNSV
jgi:hypothetical protein